MSLKRRPVPDGSTAQSTSTAAPITHGPYDALPLRTADEEHSDTYSASFISGDDDQFENETVSMPMTRYTTTNPQERSRYQALPLSEIDTPLVGRVDRPMAIVQNASTLPNVRKSQYAPLSTVDIGDEATTPSGSATAFVPSPLPSPLPPKSSKLPAWKPFALRKLVLLATLIISLILGCVVILLLVYSTLHDGLGTDGGSSAVLFGWRFTPTLIAVLFTLLPSMVFNDARRTEPFAQMSHPSGASAATSILKSPEQWWTVFAESLRRRQNHGKVNWFLLATVLVNIISLLLINPLSSALLQSQPVELVSQVPISQFGVSESQPISMAANDLVYFRTIGNVLQGLDTSAWLTDRYVIIPFWPSSTKSNLGTTLMGTTQQWKADAQVLSLALDCESMGVRKASWSKNFTDPEDGEDTEINFRSLLLTDSKGCEAGINGYIQRFTYGGGSWFSPPNMVLPVWDDSNEEEEWNHYHNSTSQCDGRQVILATSGFWQGGTSNTVNSDLKVGAWSCQSTFYAANMSVNASTTTTGTTFLVDDATFDAQRSIIPNSMIDQNRFETAFLHKNWTSMIYTADVNGRDSYGGASALLASIYDFDSASLIASPDVMRNLQRIKQRFLGEMVLATIAGNTVTAAQTGQITDTQRRVVVNTPVAIALAVLFFITSVLIGAILGLSSRRRLNLHNDPGSVAAVVKLIDGNKTIRESFHDWDKRKGRDMNQSLAKTTHFLSDGSLDSVKDTVDTSGIIV